MTYKECSNYKGLKEITVVYLGFQMVANGDGNVPVPYISVTDTIVIICVFDSH